MKCFLDAVNKKVAVYKGVGHCVGHAATARTLNISKARQTRLRTKSSTTEALWTSQTKKGSPTMMMLRRLLKNVLK